jgi:hypothetical protein
LEHLFVGTDYSVADDYEQVEYCKTAKRSEMSSYAIATSTLTTLLVALAVLSSIYGFVTRSTGSKKNEWIVAFSITRNISSLFRMSEPKDEMKCFHFLRSVTAVYIVISHIVWFGDHFPSENFGDFGNKTVMKIGFLSVSCMNVFFVMGGFLAAKSIIRDFNS